MENKPWYIEEFCKTKFGRDGGSCFECCDYEGMYTELENFLTYVAQKEREAGRLEGINSVKVNVGLLRQWLNEDRITDINKIITNEDIENWLKIKSKLKE